MTNITLLITNTMVSITAEVMKSLEKNKFDIYSEMGQEP